jgi:hypothetical protein
MNENQRRIRIVPVIKQVFEVRNPAKKKIILLSDSESSECYREKKKIILFPYDEPEEKILPIPKFYAD